jgi:hypothetical protein
MQIHNNAAGQTLLACNGWDGQGLLSDLGIGNFSGEHPDWTFAQNADAYVVKRLEVYVLPSDNPGAFWQQAKKSRRKRFKGQSAGSP